MFGECTSIEELANAAQSMTGGLYLIEGIDAIPGEAGRDFALRMYELVEAGFAMRSAVDASAEPFWGMRDDPSITYLGRAGGSVPAWPPRWLAEIGGVVFELRADELFVLP